MQLTHLPLLKTERLIILSRIVLAGCSLLAVWIDPFCVDGLASAAQTKQLLTIYLCYALLLLPLLWCFPRLLTVFGLVTHLIDITVFSGLIYLTQGMSSPFFTLFVFALFCGVLRWQKPGALWTALILLFSFFALGFVLDIMQNKTAIPVNRLILRSTFLVVITLLLIYLANYKRQLRNGLDQLANWSTVIDTSAKPDEFVGDLLRHAAQILQASRMLMVWDQNDEPVRQLVYWSEGGLVMQSIAPDRFEPLIADVLRNRTFICKHAQQSKPKVLFASDSGFESVTIAPLHFELTDEYAIRAVIGAPLQGFRFVGWLLFLDKPTMNNDDLILGSLIANQLVALMDQAIAIQDIQKVAVTEERIKMARDLHDGLLQTLAGIGLQLASITRQLDRDPQETKSKLKDLQELIVYEQRCVRLQIEQLKPRPLHWHNESASLNLRLRSLADILQKQWNIPIELTLPLFETLEQIPDDCYLLMREALINAARHAQATEIKASLKLSDGWVTMRIADNGKGFPFQGQYQLRDLIAQGIGPKSIMERVKSLNGQLSIATNSDGTTLVMAFPVEPFPHRRASDRAAAQDRGQS